jgi:energy-coupling factor transporter ATP-binding protein EcfA2
MMIDLDRLSYTYPEAARHALQEISLEISAGEAILLAGRSGSGKSTLLRTMNGLVPHFYGGTFQGQAKVAGLNTRTASPTELSNKVGTVFQEPGNRFLTDNLVDEIAFGMELVGISGPEIRSRVRAIIDRFELGSFEGRSLRQLSAGEQQRVAVAAALSRRPDLLLLDEPTSQLDSVSTNVILDWVHELRQQFGLTVVIAEHRLNRLLERVDRMAYLSQLGKLTQLGPPHEVLARLPFGTPITDAARSLGLLPRNDLRTRTELREMLLKIPHEASHSVEMVEERLRVQGISYSYNGIKALQGVEFSIYTGEIIGLLGRNGAGKSTFLRCLMGLLPPESGEIRLEGKPIHGIPVFELAKKIAYVPQWPSALLFADNLLEELAFTLRNHGLEENPPIQPKTLLEQLGLAEVAHMYPRDLSAGQRQRAALASVLITKPKVVLLDEPTLGMDPISKTDLAALLVGWKKSGTTMIVATHDVEFAAAIADRVVLLDRGQVMAQGPAAETLFSQPEYRTALQWLTGRANPATVVQLNTTLNVKGDHHAYSGSS